MNLVPDSLTDESERSNSLEPSARILVLESPPVNISVPRNILLNKTVVELLKTTASTVARTVHDHVNKTSNEIVERRINDFKSQQSKELITEGFRKGASASLSYGNSLYLYNISNQEIVQSQQELEPRVSNTLRRLARKPPLPSSPERWRKPTFMGAYGYIKELGALGRCKTLGRIDGKDLLIVLVGHKK
jgi:hypothetical protein